SFRTVQGLHATSGRALGRIQLAEQDARDAGRYIVHPALLDGCIQSALAAAPGSFSGVYLPFSIDRFETFGSAGASVTASVEVSATAGSEEILTANIDVVSDSGTLLARMTGLRLKRRKAAGPHKQWTYQVRWQQIDSRAHAASASGRWLVV